MRVTPSTKSFSSSSTRRSVSLSLSLVQFVKVFFCTSTHALSPLLMVPPVRSSPALKMQRKTSERLAQMECRVSRGESHYKGVQRGYFSASFGKGYGVRLIEVAAAKDHFTNGSRMHAAVHLLCQQSVPT